VFIYIKRFKDITVICIVVKMQGYDLVEEQLPEMSHRKNVKEYKHITVSHMNVPTGYNFGVKCISNTSSLLNSIAKYWPNDGVFEAGGTEYALPSTGFLTINEISLWVCNQHKQGFIYLYFKSVDEFNSFKNLITEKNIECKKQIENPVYRFNPFSMAWILVDKYGLKDADKDLFGYQHYVEQIEKDITNHIKYNSFLKSVGEVRSINYLLYGPPGTGKTSMIKAVASKLGCAVFIVNSGCVNGQNLGRILTPTENVATKCKLKILLFEDFDRFIVKEQIDSLMSQILNSLDGFDDKGDTIRFLTANNSDAILSIDALCNRMSSKFHFGYPNKEIFRGKLDRLMSFYDTYDKNLAEHFLDLVVQIPNLTVRPFVNFVIRHMFDENCLNVMIENIECLKNTM
jgi:hypothetical protein